MPLAPAGVPDVKVVQSHPHDPPHLSIPMPRLCPEQTPSWHPRPPWTGPLSQRKTAASALPGRAPVSSCSTESFQEHPAEATVAHSDSVSRVTPSSVPGGSPLTLGCPSALGLPSGCGVSLTVGLSSTARSPFQTWVFVVDSFFRALCHSSTFSFTLL